MKHVKFRKILQFRHVITALKLQHDFKGKNDDGSPLYIHTEPYPIIPFTGTVKLHGSNAAIVFDNKGNLIHTQSRNRILSLDKDNYGFDMFVRCLHKKELKHLFHEIHNLTEFIYENVIIYGEWCRKGIQKGIAISELEKMFVIFKVKYVLSDTRTVYMDRITFDSIDASWFLPLNMYTSSQFQQYELMIDLNNPELAQNELIKITNEVEQQCPVASAFGAKGTGEGVVWESMYKGNLFMFKVKGEKHSASKIKTIASIDVEKFEKLKEFIEATVTPNRLNQGIGF